MHWCRFDGNNIDTALLVRDNASNINAVALALLALHSHHTPASTRRGRLVHTTVAVVVMVKSTATSGAGVEARKVVDHCGRCLQRSGVLPQRPWHTMLTVPHGRQHARTVAPDPRKCGAGALFGAVGNSILYSIYSVPVTMLKQRD